MENIEFKEPTLIPAKQSKYFHLSYVLGAFTFHNNWNDSLYLPNGIYRERYSLNDTFELDELNLEFNGKLNTLYALPAHISQNSSVSGNTINIGDNISGNLAINFNFLIKGDFSFKIVVNGKDKVNGSVGLYFNNRTTDITKDFANIPSIVYVAPDNKIVCKNHEETVAIINSPSTVELEVRRTDNKVTYNVNNLDIYSGDMDGGMVFSIFMNNVLSGLSINVSKSGKAKIISPFLHIKYETLPIKSIYYYVEGNNLYPLSTADWGVDIDTNESIEAEKALTETGFGNDKVLAVWSVEVSPSQVGIISLFDKNGDTIYGIWGGGLIFDEFLRFRYADGLLVVWKYPLMIIINFRYGYSFLVKPYLIGSNLPDLGVNILRYPYFLDFSGILGDVSYKGDTNNSAMPFNITAEPSFFIRGSATVQSISVNQDKIDICVRNQGLDENALYLYTINIKGQTRNHVLWDEIVQPYFRDISNRNFVVRQNKDKCYVFTGSRILPDRYNCFNSLYENETEQCTFYVNVVKKSQDIFELTPKNNVNVNNCMAGSFCFVFNDYGDRGQYSYGTVVNVENGKLIVDMISDISSYENPFIAVYLGLEETDEFPANFIPSGCGILGNDIIVGASTKGVFSYSEDSKIFCTKPLEEDITNTSIDYTSGTVSYDSGVWLINESSYISKYIYMDKEAGFRVSGWISFDGEWSNTYVPFITYTPHLKNGFILYMIKKYNNKIYIKNSNNTEIELNMSRRYPFELRYDTSKSKAFLNINGVKLDNDFLTSNQFLSRVAEFSLSLEAFCLSFRNMSSGSSRLRLSSLKKSLTSTPLVKYNIKHSNFNNCGVIYSLYPLQDNSELLIAAQNGLFRVDIKKEDSSAVKILDSIQFGAAAGIDMFVDGDFCICNGKVTSPLSLDLYKLPYSLKIEAFELNPVLIPPYETGFAREIEGLLIPNGDGKISEVFSAIKKYMMVPGAKTEVVTRAIILKAHDVFSPMIEPFVPYDIVKKTKIYSIQPIDDDIVNKIWESFKINIPSILNSVFIQRIDKEKDLTNMEKISTVCAAIFWRYCHYVATGE